MCFQGVREEGRPFLTYGVALQFLRFADARSNSRLANELAHHAENADLVGVGDIVGADSIPFVVIDSDEPASPRGYGLGEGGPLDELGVRVTNRNHFPHTLVSIVPIPIDENDFPDEVESIFHDSLPVRDWLLLHYI